MLAALPRILCLALLAHRERELCLEVALQRAPGLRSCRGDVEDLDYAQTRVLDEHCLLELLPCALSKRDAVRLVFDAQGFDVGCHGLNGVHDVRHHHLHLDVHDRLGHVLGNLLGFDPGLLVYPARLDAPELREQVTGLFLDRKDELAALHELFCGGAEISNVLRFAASGELLDDVIDGWRELCHSVGIREELHEGFVGL